MLPDNNYKKENKMNKLLLKEKKPYNKKDLN